MKLEDLMDGGEDEMKQQNIIKKAMAFLLVFCLMAGEYGNFAYAETISETTDIIVSATAKRSCQHSHQCFSGHCLARVRK